MYVRGERKKEQRHHHLLLSGASRRQTTSWPGVVDYTAIAAATALAWLGPEAPRSTKTFEGNTDEDDDITDNRTRRLNFTFFISCYTHSKPKY
jgi:hypothetical protein